MPHFHIVLVEPLIPQNTGNVGRLVAATGATMHLVHPLGFEISDARVKRAGLDYWPWVDLKEHASWEAFERWRVAEHPGAGCYFLSKKARRLYTEVRYRDGDFLIFGQETKGLSEVLLAQNEERACRIPIFNDNVRSLNMANAVSIVLYEAIRQTGPVQGLE